MQKNYEYTNYPEFLEYLNSFAEPDFAAFQRKLIPGETILGVRTPQVRTIAKQIAKSDWRRFLTDVRDDTLEEVEMQGLVIGCRKDGLRRSAGACRRFCAENQKLGKLRHLRFFLQVPEKRPRTVFSNF